MNGGTSGYSTDQEYLFYREEGVKYSPQIVILFFYYNDALYNGLDRNIQIPKPLLQFRNGRAEVANYPVPPQKRPEPSAVTAGEGSFRGSAALDWVAERVQASAPRVYEGVAKTGLWPPIRVQRPPEEFEVFRARLSPDYLHAWSMTRRILGALRSETEAHGARLLVAYVPSAMETNDTVWEATRLRYRLRPEKWDRGQALRQLVNVCAGENVPLFDLTPILRRGTGLVRRPYFDHDSHWNAYGQQLAAAAIAEHLSVDGWLANCARQDPRLR